MISHHIDTSMEHNERDGDIRQLSAEVVGGPEKFEHRPQPGPVDIPYGVADDDDPLSLDLDKLLDEIGDMDDGNGGKEPGGEGEDGRDGPPGPNAIGDHAHQGRHDCTVELGGDMVAVTKEVDEDAVGTAYGFYIQEPL